MAVYLDRADAGRKLARLLSAYRNLPDVTVLALPRGGVPVGLEVAHALRTPFDVLLVRKLGFPGQPELAMGAIAGGGARVLNPLVLGSLHLSDREIEAVCNREQAELQRREQLYRGGRPSPAVSGRTIILVDDGIATGASMRAAVQVVRRQGARRIVVAVPVAPHAAIADLSMTADEVVCAFEPANFRAISEWYENFSQISEDEVVRLLKQASEPSILRAGNQVA